MNIRYGNSSDTQKYIISKIISEKENNKNYKVIDIGGTAGGWSQDFVDLTVDICAISNDKNINFDICIENQWLPLLNIVKSGKFDYCICTHTLEDVYNPITALELMSKIAKSGIITMPNITTELSHIENDKWIGYIHHRWLYHTTNNRMLIIPKITCLENIINDRIKYDPTKYEIIYEWVDIIEYDIFMNNYLGPNVDTVIDNYNTLINNIKNR